VALNKLFPCTVPLSLPDKMLTNTLKVTALVLIILTSVAYLILISAYLWRREKFPIQQRFPLLVFVEALIFVSLALANLLAVAFNDNFILANCQFYMGLVGVGEVIALPITTYRFIVIIYKDLSTKILIHNDKIAHVRKSASKNVVGVEKSEFNKCFQFVVFFLFPKIQQIGLHKFAMILITPVFASGIGQIVLVSLSRNLVTINMPECYSQVIQVAEKLQVTIFTYLAVLATLGMFTFLQLKDNFSLGTELRGIVVVLGLMFIATIGLVDQDTYQKFFQDAYAYQFLIGSFIVPLLIGIQIVFPLYLSLEYEKRVNNRASIVTPNKNLSEKLMIAMDDLKSMLNEVLQDPEGRNLLRDFLESEFSVENLLFIEDCRSFKKACLSLNSERKSLTELALEIRDKFVLESAPNCVNLSHKIRKPLLNNLSKISSEIADPIDPELFEEACDEVEQMLIRDSFQRFRCTSQYQAFRS
jgi:hypothetical protein